MDRKLDNGLEKHEGELTLALVTAAGPSGFHRSSLFKNERTFKPRNILRTIALPPTVKPTTKGVKHLNSLHRENHSPNDFASSPNSDQLEL